MRCPYCAKDETRVLESRQTKDALRRRRECGKCGRRFTTYERLETTNLLVVKRNGAREQYDRAKLRSGIIKACQKRPVSSSAIEHACDGVEDALKKARTGEIASTRVGELVMQQLKRLDKVAYIRFASVYRDFKDPEDFEAAVQEVERKRGK
jgi:transcriptional repressor NrdR